MAENQWYVYILRCVDDTLYTGITTDPQRRLKQHNAGTGAKYTRGRGPVEMVYCEPAESYSDALRREYAIKQLSKEEKEKLFS